MWMDSRTPIDHFPILLACRNRLLQESVGRIETKAYKSLEIFYCIKNGDERMTKQKFVVVIEQDEDGQYIGTVPTLKGCYSYGKTLDELMRNIEEAIEANLEALKIEQKIIPSSNFLGIQEIEIEVQ